MTEAFNKESKANLYNQYGGEITIDDFNTYAPNKNRIINQIAANELFNILQNKLKKKKEKENYKKMTLKELREIKLISDSDGRPSLSLTDEKWQKELEVRKLFITPYKNGSTKKFDGKYSKESGKWNEETRGEYLGCTNWQSYSAYINSILHNIRSGQIDYCYYIYQILDLLKFHFHNLKTKYMDGYWEVWLDNK